MQFKLNHTDLIISSLQRIWLSCLNESYSVNESLTGNWPMPISNRSHILHTHRVERHTSEERSKARKVQCSSPWWRTFVFSILTTEKSDPVIRNPHLCLHSRLHTAVVTVYRINEASVRSSDCKEMWKITVIFLFWCFSTFSPEGEVPRHHQRFNPAPYRYFVINNRWIE